VSSVRTQIYLGEEQRRALKLLAASSDSTVSDLVRRAVDQLLAGEFDGKDWTLEMNAVVDRLRSSGPALSEQEVDDAIAVRRARKREAKGVV
jgi:Arc/MetJ-type ribon-helix-helix transcriptional regulator